MRGCSLSTQRRLRAKNAAQKRWHNEEVHDNDVQIADPKMMAIACIENGSTYTKSRGILAAQGIESPPKSTYYYNQRKVNATVKELCNESLKKEADKMTPNTVITLDGAYAHRRNSSMCHAAFMNHTTNKIVAGSVVTKARKGGDFYGSSNMLETECIRRNLQQIDINKVEKFCHDRDNKTGDLMAKAKPGINEIIDANHAKKGFETCWKKLINGVYNATTSIKKSAVNNAKKAITFVTNVEYKKNFTGLKTHVKRWFEYLLKKKDWNADKKAIKWKNVEQHVIGNHDACNHRKNVKYVWKKGVQNEFLRNDFHSFVEDTQKIFLNVDPNVSTNKNESLHAEASRIADKNVPWGRDSYEARISYTYLKHNEPENCSQMIRERNRVKSNIVDQRFIEERARERVQRSATRSTPEYKESERKRREKFRKEMSTKKGDYIGIPYSQLCNDNK